MSLVSCLDPVAGR